MATKVKDVTLKKDKKPRPSANPRVQGSPKRIASQLGSNDKEKSLPSATSSGKPRASSLKPTVSSKPAETSTVKYVKKSTTSTRQNEDTTSTKPTLLRRKSLDRPPSSSREQRLVISPDPRERAASRVKTMPPRSTSLSSSKPVSVTTKPGASKSVKPVLKSQPPGSASRLLGRSVSALPKNETSSAPVSSSSSPTNSDKTAQSLDPEKKQFEEETLLLDETEEVLVPFDVSEMDNEEHTDSVGKQVNNAEEENLETSDVTDASDGQTLPQDMPAEEAHSELVNKSEEWKVENQPEGEDNQGKEEGRTGHPEEGSPGEVGLHEADQGKEEENRIDELNPVSDEKPVEEGKKEEENENHDHEEFNGEVMSSKEGGQEVIEEATEAVPTTPVLAAVSVQKRQGAQGKKESPGAYNDVIEETKNKLLEKRKNKVKALVGAFETVIDYESGSK